MRREKLEKGKPREKGMLLKMYSVTHQHTARNDQRTCSQVTWEETTLPGRLENDVRCCNPTHPTPTPATILPRNSILNVVQREGRKQVLIVQVAEPMQLVRFPCTHHMKKEALCTAPPMVNTTPPITMVSFLPIKSEIAEKKIAEPYILTSYINNKHPVVTVYTCFTGTQTTLKTSICYTETRTLLETSTCYTETRTIMETSTCYTETRTILETSTCYTETRTILETSSLSAKERRAGKSVVQ